MGNRTVLVLVPLIELHTLFDKNKASLTMYDEMVKLFNGFFASNEFSKMTRLSTRKKFMAETEKLFGIAAMKPTYGCVRLEDNTVATVPVFDAKAMILSLLHDPSIMKHENFAPGAGIGRDDLDRQHVRMMQSIQRQSERDFPRGATRNGIVDGTKCQASERRGNLFSLTCIAHTHDGLILKEEMKLSDDKWRSLKLFLRQYLAMEEWFHSDNNKLEVQNARRKIAKVLKMLQELFPRGEGTNGYNIPKMHGMTKMQSYMMRFGCAMNFFGGTGESSHKQFVKAPGQKTQRRVSEFAHQTAKQYHHVMVTHHALTCMTLRGENNSVHDTAAMMHDRIVMEGKYTIHTSGGWMEDNTLRLNNNLLGVYLRDHAEISQNNTITGYTHARIFDKDGIRSIFYAHPTYRSGPWYDWAFVHFLEGEEELYYPSRVLGFVETLEGVEAVIQCSVRPMKWTTVEKKMLVAFDLGDKDESFVRVPLSSFVHTLCVIRDYGGEKNKYFVVLPKRGWGCYFGKDIMKSSNEY